MAKYLARSCPRCNGYLGIVIPQTKRKLTVRSVNGQCLKCGYRLAWILIAGRRRALIPGANPPFTISYP